MLVFGYEAVAIGPRGGALEEQIEIVGDDAVAEIRDELIGRSPRLAIEVEMVQQRPVDALLRVADARHADR